MLAPLARVRFAGRLRTFSLGGVDPRLGLDVDDMFLDVTQVGDSIVFFPRDLESGVEPWATDGTVEETFRLADIAPGPVSSQPSGAIVAGNHVYFIANDRQTGRELWAIPLSAFGPGCPGDCDSNGATTIDELVVGLDISLGAHEVTACPAFDLDGRRTISIDELIAAVESAIDGCP